VIHCSSEDLRVHSRNLESILLPLTMERVGGVLQVKVLGAVPAHQRLPSIICHYSSTSCTRGGTSMLADHLLSVEDLHYAGELHVPWPRNTLDPIVRGTGDTQLKQKTVKLCENSQ
jgi:hypothetical protein